MDNQKHIFDEYGNYDFPTDTKQKGVNTVSSGAEKNKHFVEAKKMLDGKKFLLFSERLKLAEEYEEWVKKPLEDGSKIKDCALSVITFMQIKGFCKIPEGAVALTEEELEHRVYVNAMENELCKKCRDRIAKETVPVAMYELAKAFHDEKCAEFEKLCYDYNKLKTELEQTRKETAEKFAEMVKMAFYYEFDELIPSIMADKIDEICKEITEGKV